jgi:hypothetical protein
MNPARLWTIGRPLFRLDIPGVQRARLFLQFERLRMDARSASPSDTQKAFVRLLERGLSWESPAQDGVTPLMWAAGEGTSFLESIKSSLIMARLPLNPKVQDKRGNTVMHHWTRMAIEALGNTCQAERAGVIEKLDEGLNLIFGLRSAEPLDIENHAHETPLQLMLEKTPDLLFEMLRTLSTDSLSPKSKQTLFLAALKAGPCLPMDTHAAALYTVFRNGTRDVIFEGPGQQMGAHGPLMSLLVDEVPHWSFEAMDVLYDERHLFSTAAWLARDAKGECALTRLWTAGGKRAHRNLGMLVEWSVEPKAIETAYLTECATQEREALLAGLPASGDATSRPPRRHL